MVKLRRAWSILRIRSMLPIAPMIIFAGLVAGTPVAAEQPIIMKLATATVNDVQVEAIKRYAQRIEALTNGRIKTELYPAAQLGSNARMIEGLQLGTVEVWVGPPAYLAGLDPRFQVLDAPGVFDDMEHAFRTIRDPQFRDVFLAIGEKKGLIGVGLFLYSTTSLATREPIRKLGDFRGRKLRVMGSKMEREAVDRLGATAVPMDFSEVVAALQQGTIDGIKTGLSVFTSLKLYDVVKYVTLSGDEVIPEVIMISKQWYDGLPSDIQTALVKEGRALEPELFDYTVAAQTEARKIWEAKGGEIIELPKSDHDTMMKELSGNPIPHNIRVVSQRINLLFTLLC